MLKGGGQTIKIHLLSNQLGHLLRVILTDGERNDYTQTKKLPAGTTHRVAKTTGGAYLSKEGQAMCFYAGANSIFYGGKLLTATNPKENADMELLHTLGLTPQEPKKACMNDLQKTALTTV